MKHRPMAAALMAAAVLLSTQAMLPAFAAGDTTGNTISLGQSVLNVNSDSHNRPLIGGTARCPAGYVVVSIGYQDSDRGNSDVANALGIICAKLESNGTLGARTERIYAGSLGSRTFYDINCPSGTVAYGAATKDFPINSENSDFLDGVSTACRKISAAGLGNAIGYQGNSDLDASSRNLSGFQCPGAAVVTGIVERDFGSSYPANPTATDSYDLYCAPVIVKTAPAQPQCSDSKDNDGDGKIDYPYDPGCTTPNDDDETDQQKPQCSDSKDNDGDGKIDWNDPGCYTNGVYDPNDSDETDQVQKPQCSDGKDNDGDGKVDWQDPGCYTNGNYDPNDNDETDQQSKPQCSDGKDNDGDGKVDWQDPGCYTNGNYDPNDNDETDQQTKPQCSDGKDNDGDGKVDWNDPGCYTNGNYDPNDNNETNSTCTFCGSLGAYDTTNQNNTQQNNNWGQQSNNQGWNAQSTSTTNVYGTQLWYGW